MNNGHFYAPEINKQTTFRKPKVSFSRYQLKNKKKESGLTCFDLDREHLVQSEPLNSYDTCDQLQILDP